MASTMKVAVALSVLTVIFSSSIIHVVNCEEDFVYPNFYLPSNKRDVRQGFGYENNNNMEQLADEDVAPRGFLDSWEQNGNENNAQKRPARPQSSKGSTLQDEAAGSQQNVDPLNLYGTNQPKAKNDEAGAGSSPSASTAVVAPTEAVKQRVNLPEPVLGNDKGERIPLNSAGSDGNAKNNNTKEDEVAQRMGLSVNVGPSGVGITSSGGQQPPPPPPPMYIPPPSIHLPRPPLVGRPPSGLLPSIPSFPTRPSSTLIQCLQTILRYTLRLPFLLIGGILGLDNNSFIYRYICTPLRLLFRPIWSILFMFFPIRIVCDIWRFLVNILRMPLRSIYLCIRRVLFGM